MGGGCAPLRRGRDPRPRQRRGSGVAEEPKENSAASGSAWPGRCGVGAAGRTSGTRQWEGSALEMCWRRTAADSRSLAGRGEPQLGQHNRPLLPRWAQAPAGGGWHVARSRLPVMAASRPLPNPVGSPHPRVTPRTTPRARRGLPDKHPGRASPQWGGHVPLHNTPAFAPRRQRRRSPGWMLRLGNHNPQPFPSPGMFFPKRVPLHQGRLGVGPSPGGCELPVPHCPPAFPQRRCPGASHKAPRAGACSGNPRATPSPCCSLCRCRVAARVLRRASLNRSSLENPASPSHREPHQVAGLGAGSRAGELGPPCPPSCQGLGPARVSQRANTDTGTRI